MSVAPEPAAPPDRFPCTSGGAIARSQRRLRLLLLGLAVVLLALAAWTLSEGRVFVGLLTAALAFVLWTAWRMSGELEPLWLELDDERLTIRLRRRLMQVPRADIKARPLEEDERAHLETLASSGGFTAATGGFDSHLIGEFDLFASNFDHALLIESGDTRLIVTPDDPDRFLVALRRG